MKSPFRSIRQTLFLRRQGYEGHVISGKLLRYLGYAVGEVFLIFIGITLAIGFENSRDQRRQEELAKGLLIAIQLNLQANIAELERNIKEDESIIESTSIILTHLSNSQTWGNDSLSAHLERSLHWSSPFFTASGYESLKQNGLHLIVDETLRAEIVHLFETTYAYLVGDLDRLMWVFMGSVTYPIRMRELVRLDSGGDEPILRAPRDYTASLERGELRTLLLDHQGHLISGIQLRNQALAETRDLIRSINTFFDDGNTQ